MRQIDRFDIVRCNHCAMPFCKNALVDHQTEYETKKCHCGRSLCYRNNKNYVGTCSCCRKKNRHIRRIFRYYECQGCAHKMLINICCQCYLERRSIKKQMVATHDIIEKVFESMHLLKVVCMINEYLTDHALVVKLFSRGDKIIFCNKCEPGSIIKRT
jgi:hypothetical protein